jgi:hypothetical protein
MSLYSFKKEAKVYILSNNLQYNVDISDIDFSQTFTENSFIKKTIQVEKFFEGSVINKANPANFSFSMPLIRESDFSVVVDRLIDYETFDIYIETKQDIFKITKCVITSGTYIIERNKELRLNITGEASKLELVGVPGIFTIPGTPQARSSTMSYNLIKNLFVELDTEDISEGVYSLSIELQNNIQWVKNKFIQGACLSNEIIFPEMFTIESRILSGNISRYLTEDNDRVQTVSSSSRLTIEAGQTISNIFSGVKLVDALCSYTNRLSTGAVFMENYEWRFIDNTSTLSNLLPELLTIP